MELIVAGAGPAYSDRPGSVGACYLVVARGEALVLDLGHGSYSALASRWDPTRLLAVVVSHLHPDHFVDLVPLRHFLRWEFDPPRRVRVLGPEGLATRLDLLHEEPGFSAAALDVEELSEGTQRIGPFTLETRRVSHTEESYGFRVSLTGEAAPGLVYSGDCGIPDDLRPLIRPGDTLLVEAAFGPGPVPPGVWHLDGPSVGVLAAETAAGRVLVTHLLDWRHEAETLAAIGERFGGEATIVQPGDRFSL